MPTASLLWTQFILTAALERVRGDFVDSPNRPAFCYVDTHAGSGWLDPPAPFLDRFRQAADSIQSQAFFRTLKNDDRHPGSWVLAARVLDAIDSDFEIDINDISPMVLETSRLVPCPGRHRRWRHDWFQFLRSRLSMQHMPHFVFIDLPKDDERGLDYAIEAALLLETMNIPYALAHGRPAPQHALDEIGRVGLEFSPQGGCVILGGDAQLTLPSLLPDLQKLAIILDGALNSRQPATLVDTP